MKNVDKLEIEYEIVAFDEDKLTVDVKFPQEDRWARVSVANMQSLDDLDNAVKQFVPHVEDVEAAQDLVKRGVPFMKDAVGQKRYTNRFSRSQEAAKHRMRQAEEQEVLNKSRKTQAVEPMPEEVDHVNNLIDARLKFHGLL